MYMELIGMDGPLGSQPEIFTFDRENELFRGRRETLENLVDAVLDSVLLGGITLIYEVITGALIGVHSTFWMIAPVMVYFTYCLLQLLENGIVYWKQALVPAYPFVAREAADLKIIACGASNMELLLKNPETEEEYGEIVSELLRGKPAYGFYILEYHNCRYIKENKRFYYFRADTQKRKNLMLKLPKIYHNQDRLKEDL